MYCSTCGQPSDPSILARGAEFDSFCFRVQKRLFCRFLPQLSGFFLLFLRRRSRSRYHNKSQQEEEEEEEEETREKESRKLLSGCNYWLDCPFSLCSPEPAEVDLARKATKTSRSSFGFVDLPFPVLNFFLAPNMSAQSSAYRLSSYLTLTDIGIVDTLKADVILPYFH